MTTFTIDKNRLSEVALELYELLQKIMPTENDIIFVMALAKGDKNRQLVIDFIKKNNPTADEIEKFADERF